MGGGLTPKGIVAKMANSVCLSFWVSTLIWPSLIQIGVMACITPAWSSRELSLNYTSNLSDSSYCLWTNRNFPLLEGREIRTRLLQLASQSLSFPSLPSLFSFISPRTSLAALD